MTITHSGVALVTGGGKGIGAGIAEALARTGMSVAVNYAHGKDTADAVVDRIRSAGGTAAAFRADVGNEQAVEAMFTAVRDTLGPVRTLVNNAGLWNFQTLLDVTVAEYRRHYDTNVLGNLLTSRQFARQPDADGGTIINLTSVGIGPASPGTTLYIGTKAAIASMTRILAVELAPRGIRVNAIAAGLVDTEGTRASGFIGSAAADATVATIPLGRMGTPEDIADVAAFLASEAARYVTGETIFAAGGMQLT